MNLSFYIGATAAHQQEKRLNIQGNNIANVNTYGFKAEKGRFTQLMYESIPAVEGPEAPMGLGARLLMSCTDLRDGGIAATGMPYDFMISGNGFFGVMDLQRNEVLMTRNGAFKPAQLLGPVDQVDQYGEPVSPDRMYLSDGMGRFVMNQNGGLIRIVDQSAELPVGVFDFDIRQGMQHVDGTYFMPPEAADALQQGTGILRRCALETSNVDLADEINKVIESQRAYSMALKMVQTSDEIETTINGLRG